MSNGEQLSTPIVSVIMNCYNSARYLREAIDSVYAQTYKKWEIIFWDNASTDNSAAIARSYDDKLKYFKSEANVPLGKARNWAIEKAQGKYVAFLDDADLFHPVSTEEVQGRCTDFCLALLPAPAKSIQKLHFLVQNIGSDLQFTVDDLFNGFPQFPLPGFP